MLEQPAYDFEALDAHPAIAADEEAPPPKQQPCSEKFQLPGALWRTIFGCYAFFILALATATGGSAPARFVLVVSALFILVYFSTATILARLGAPDKSVIAAGRPLQTIYGPLSAGEVWVQMLIIPVALASFGAVIVVVVWLAGA